MDVTVYFEDVDSGRVLVEYRPDFGCGGVLGYDIIESGLTGEYRVRVEGQCVVVVSDGEQMVLDNESAVVELVAGCVFLLGRVGAELPSLEAARGEFNAL